MRCHAAPPSGTRQVRKTAPSRPDPNLQEEDRKTALHKASWNCDHVLMRMLLEAGADARAMDVNGCAPIQYLLKVTEVRPAAVPQLCFQLLLNHNAARIYPPQFHKVPTAASTGKSDALGTPGGGALRPPAVFCAGAAVLPRLPWGPGDPGQLL